MDVYMYFFIAALIVQAGSLFKWVGQSGQQQRRKAAYIIC